MKRIAIIALLCLVVSIYSDMFGFPKTELTENNSEVEKQETKMDMPHLSLDSSYIDLGDIEKDAKAEGVMRFSNTGNAPLMIMKVYADCGCTVPSYSTETIEPGGIGEIKVRFNSKGRSSGTFRKTLRIRSNADNPRVSFYIKGRVM